MPALTSEVPSRLRGWARRWLPPSRALPLALAIAFVLSLPSVTLGVMLDDFMHMLLMRGLPAPGSAWDLFRFAPGDPEKLLPFIKTGPYPWWTLPDLKLAFWRPLSSALANLDLALFGDTVAAYHLHSMAWYLALVFAAALLLRRVLPPTLAGGALLLFAIAPSHILPAMWLANRNSLVAAAPALLGLVAHLRWRDDGWKPGLPLSVAGYATGLLAGESALGVFAYLGAFELLAGRGRARQRLLALSPAAALGLVYVAVYRGLGSGAFGSSSYIDPGLSPGAFLAAAPGRLAALLACQLSTLSADAWLFAPSLRPLQVGLGVLCTGGVALLLRRAWPALEASERRALPWLIAGALGSLLPVLATFPMSRLLLVPSLGGSAVLAVLLRHGVRAAPRLDRLACAALAILHVPLAIVSWPGQALILREGSRRVVSWLEDSEIDDTRVSQQRIVLLAGPDPAVALYPPMVRAYHGHPLPAAWWVLSFAPYPHRFTRTGPDAFELEVLGGHMLDTVFEQLFRSSDRPVEKGKPIALEGMTVTVLEDDGTGPTRVAFKADRPLEDPSLWFLTWRDRRLRRFELPPVGQSVVIPKDKGLMEP